ncbi:MAG: sodium:solute symporter family protein [candidate division WOR-3 bacterium]
MPASFYFWLAAIAYFLFVIIIGYVIWRKIHKDTATHQILDFWIASRRFPGWRLAISLTAGWLMLGWLGYGMSMIYQMGLSGLWILPLPWFILCFIIILMVPFVRRLPAISLPEAIQKRFGGPTRLIIGLCSIFVFTSWTGAELFMVGHLGAPFLKVTPVMTMIIVAIPIMIYTYFGGFRAVVITDFLQFVFMAIFITVLGIVSINAALAITNGDIISTLKNTPTPYYGKDTMFNLFACGIAMPIILLFAYLPGWMIEQDLLLRIQGANSLKEAKKGAWLALVLITVFVITIPTIIAFCALILFPPGLESSASAIGADATGIISAIILQYFPFWAQILMLVGLLSAQMSTVDTFANVTALPLTYDIIQPNFMKGLSREKIVRWSRVLSIFAIGLALVYAINATSLMDVYILSSGVLTASIAIPAFAIFWKKANRLGIILSSILGFVGNVAFYILEYHIWKHNYSPKWLADTYLGYIIIGLVGSIIGLIVGSLIGKPSTPEEIKVVAPQPLEGVEIFDIAKE